MEINQYCEDQYHQDTVSYYCAQDSTFLTDLVSSCTCNGDGLRRDHFRANTTGCVTCNQEVRVDRKLFCSRFLHCCEQCARGSVGTRQEYAEVTKERREEREERTSCRERQAERVAHGRVVHDVSQTEDASDREDWPFKLVKRAEEASNTFSETVVRHQEETEDTGAEDCSTGCRYDVKSIFRAVRSVSCNDRDRFDNFVVKTRPEEREAFIHANENVFEADKFSVCPEEYENREDDVRAPCANDFAARVCTFLRAVFVYRSIIVETIDFRRFPNFEETCHNCDQDDGR